MSVPVYTTGTPYQTYTVSMNGYLPYTAALTSVPAPGESIDLYVTLTPSPTASPAHTPSKQPLPFSLIVFGRGIADDIAIRK